MTIPRTRSAPLAALIALAAALAVGILGASAQAPALELPPLPHEPGALAIRGDGTVSEDGVHLEVSEQNEPSVIVQGGELLVEDEDGSFEIRAYVIGGDGATATAYVRDLDNNIVKQSELYIGCPEARECMSASDFHVDAGEGGSWHVDVEYGVGEHGAWQLEVYTTVHTAVLYLPPFPAPPVHAIRGNGETLEDSEHLRVTDRNSTDEIVVRGELIIEDEDGTFEVVAYIEGPDGAAATVNVYADVADGDLVETRLVEIACPNADICLQEIEFRVNSDPGTYAVDVEREAGTLGPWQLEVYNYVIDDADAMAMALPGGGTGGLLGASGGASSTPIIVLVASIIAGIAALGFGLALRRQRGAA